MYTSFPWLPPNNRSVSQVTCIQILTSSFTNCRTLRKFLSPLIPLLIILISKMMQYTPSQAYHSDHHLIHWDLKAGTSYGNGGGEAQCYLHKDDDANSGHDHSVKMIFMQTIKKSSLLHLLNMLSDQLTVVYSRCRK